MDSGNKVKVPQKPIPPRSPRSQRRSGYAIEPLCLDFLCDLSDISAVKALQSALEQRDSDPQSDCGGDREKHHVSPNRAQSGLLQQEALETVDGVGEWIDEGDGSQPLGKRRH